MKGRENEREHDRTSYGDRVANDGRSSSALQTPFPGHLAIMRGTKHNISIQGRVKVKPEDEMEIDCIHTAAERGSNLIFCSILFFQVGHVTFSCDIY